MLCMYRIIFPVLHAAMNLASVLEPATVGWKRHMYAIIPPASRMQMPPKEHWVLWQVAQSELAKACAIRAVKNNVGFIAVDIGYGTIGKFEAWCCLPEVEAFVARIIEEF